MTGVLRLDGAPEARGVALGRAQAASVRAYLDEEPGPSPDAVRAVVTPYARCTARYLPDTAAEVDGLARGAGVDGCRAWWMQLRREIAPVPAADCSTVALPRAGLLGQTVDLPARWSTGLRVLEVHPARADPPALVLTFDGLLGYLGLNAAGIGLSINMMRSGGWRVGVPPYLLVRQILRCRDLDAVLALLRRVPRASSRCFTVVQGTTGTRIEMTATRLRTDTGPGPLATTNHFLHPDLVAADASDAATRMESRLRLARLRRLVGAGVDGAGVDGAGQLRELLDHPHLQAGPAHGPDDVATAAAVVLDVRRGALDLRPADGAWTRLHGSWAS